MTIEPSYKEIRKKLLTKNKHKKKNKEKTNYKTKWKFSKVINLEKRNQNIA